MSSLIDDAYANSPSSAAVADLVQKNSEETESDDFYTQLFKIYDTDQTGFISIDKFILITQQSMGAEYKFNEKKLKELFQVLDPFNFGHIDFNQFKVGIERLTSSNDDYLNTEENFDLQDSNKKLEQNDSAVAFTNEHNQNQTFFDSSLSLLDIDSKSGQNSPYSLSNNTFIEYDIGSPNQTSKPQFELSAFQISNQENIDQAFSEPLDIINEGELIDFNNFESKEKGENVDMKQDQRSVDSFGLDIEIINNHRKSLSMSKSFSNFHDSINSENIPSSQSFIESKKRVKESFQSSLKNGINNNGNSRVDEERRSSEEYFFNMGPFLTSNISIQEHEQMLEMNENKIKEISQQNENLQNENGEYANKINKLVSENSSLMEKIKELEEHNIELEKKYQKTLNEEQNRFQEQMYKSQLKIDEERDVFHMQLNNLESQIKSFKEENSKYVKEINEMNKKIVQNEEKFMEEIVKFNNLSADYQKVSKEKEDLKNQLEIQTVSNQERVDSLMNVIKEIEAKYQFAIQKQRSTTVYNSDDSYMPSNTRHKELENELNLLRNENNQLNVQIEELNAQILKNNIDSGRLLLNLTSGVSDSPSLAAEIDNMSKDDLMEKLKAEQQSSQRLKEYLDNILGKIMEYNPELLEICVNGGGNKPVQKKPTETNKARKLSQLPVIGKQIFNKI